VRKFSSLFWGALLAMAMSACQSDVFSPPEPSEQLKSALSPANTPTYPMASPYYPDIMSFLRELTEPYFNSTVCHWPAYPVPIRVGAAINGEIDLAGCLAEAVDRWNLGEASPWFTFDPGADWGIRLIHFPDLEMHPPARAQITRLDDQGRPLRIHIILGNNYATLQQRPYAVRALVHELGHALFLWGHSQDPAHVLWGGGPPLVDTPSLEERKAAHLWRDLPEGLNLNLLPSAGESRTASWPPGDRP
jgi:hypothetical protein